MNRFIPCLVLPLFALALSADAQMRGRGRIGGESGGESAAASARTSVIERRDHDIRATGLQPAFPSGVVCTPIASPYGSPTRYDGSPRPADRNGGLHGGMDLTLAEGTPLLAVADGEVIAKGEGGRMEGIFLWLRSSPEDSGLPFWIFAKYQHLSTMPAAAIGARVKVGQIVASSGGTGTAGGHYGATGYPHLHLSTHYAPVPDFQAMGMFGSMLRVEGGRIADPMILYRRDLAELNDVDAHAEGSRTIEVPVAAPDGAIRPPGSRTVWPVACRVDSDALQENVGRVPGR